MRCDICRGTKVIHLPVIKPLVADAMSTPIDEMLDVSHRDYPCPECSETLVDVLHPWAESSVTSTQLLSEGSLFRERARSGLARELGMRLMKEGLIRFEEQKSDEFHPRFPGGATYVRATVAVVPHIHLNTLEARIAERQYALAEKGTQMAVEEIEVWGRDYEVTSISKAQAIRCVRSALDRLKLYAEKWKEMRK